ncbi:protein of unknown function [Bradyrhizobium vignae]|uniref:Uncharacterized protein n=1 Tax=Bradyrhizobium vignae TaxID=1549949 RepID=A0A2U3Q9Z9_9BRAD|nr:protein of unknown function [Bradyrhizobium vignae]
MLLVADSQLRLLAPNPRLIDHERLRGQPVNETQSNFIVALSCGTIDHDSCNYLKAAVRVRDFQYRHIMPAKALEDDQSVANGKRKEQLLSILNLLRYAEAEIAELHLDTSKVLLGAAIADVAQHLE